MKNILFALMALVCTVCHANNFKVDSITFKHRLYQDCESCHQPEVDYSIPQVKAANPKLNSVADSINTLILNYLDYDDDIEVFSDFCHGVSFNYEMEDGYLLLDIEYIGYGAHGDVENRETLLFDLKTGDKVTFNKNSGIRVPFASLFTLDGYFKFLNSRNWDTCVYNAFFEAYKDSYEYDTKNDTVAEIEVDSSEVNAKAFGHGKYAQFHIDYSIDENNFYFWRESCYYADFCYAERCFEPGHFDVCLIKELKPYLNKIGKVVTNKKKSRIQKILAAVRLKETVSSRMFFEVSNWECEYKDSPGNLTKEEEAEIIAFNETQACKYTPYKVAIDYSHPNKIKGYLFIGDKKEGITGYQQDGTTYLKSKQSDWSFNFTEEERENGLGELGEYVFERKDGGGDGIIVGCNTSDDPY